MSVLFSPLLVDGAQLNESDQAIIEKWRARSPAMEYCAKFTDGKIRAA